MTSRGVPIDPGAWSRIVLDLWAMQIEASAVIALRMMRLAGGGSLAARESERMVAEKLMLQWDLAMRAATGSLGNTPEAVARNSVRHTRRKVRANRSRLAGR